MNNSFTEVEGILQLLSLNLAGSMADVNSYSPVSASAKDPKQLKKEKKGQERLQKEREKQEKKLEKERKKLEENERKQREREAKINAKEQPQQNGAEATGEKSTGEQTTKENGAPASPPQSPPGADAAADTAATTSTVNGHQRPVSAHCWPEKVKVAEPPGQITGFGEPIAIIFDATRAGEGPMSASCTGASVGAVPVAVSEPWSAIFNVHFTPNSADVYTLSVKWGGVDIAGSPFTINLSRLSDTNGAVAVGLPQPAMQAAEEKKKVDEVREKEENGKEEVVGVISDDPFEMAFQASRLLGELLFTPLYVDCKPI